MASNREREPTGTVRTYRLSAIAVRPYRRGIRDKVFELLERVGCFIREEDVIVAGTSDEDAVRRVVSAMPRILLVPFHAHRDAEGRMLDGMSFLRALADASGADFRWRVVMPVSGQGAASLALTRSGSTMLLEPEVESAILTLEESQLADPATESRLERFLRG